MRRGLNYRAKVAIDPFGSVKVSLLGCVLRTQTLTLPEQSPNQALAVQPGRQAGVYEY